ncbi:hypothetical protein GCM10023238_01120 [Streptomyces heliomycini]
MLTGVADARERAAVLTVGADARIESSTPLPSDLPDQVRRAPGVREVTALGVVRFARPGSDERTVPVAGVDPAGYAALTRHTGIGAFDRKALEASGTSKGAARPGLARGRRAPRRPALPRPHGGRQFRHRADRAGARADPRGRRQGVPGRGPVGALRPVRADDPAAGDRRPPGRGRAARGGGRRGPGPTPRRGTRRLRRLDLQSGAERVYAAAVAAGAGYASSRCC